jgi:hypothetical protein
MAEVDEEQRGEDARLKLALEHASTWFSLHARQRMDGVNFFIVASALLVSAFGAAVTARMDAVAMGIGLLGSWVSLWFNRLDRRASELVKAGEAPMRVLQRRLAAATAVPELAMLDRVEEPHARWASYSRVIDVFHATTFFAFAVGAIYAAVRWLTSR